MAPNDFTAADERPPVYRQVAFLPALRRHATVIAALLRREALLRSHSPFESILAICEPLILIAAITTAWHFFVRLPPYGDSVLLFLTSGLFPYYFFIYVSRRMRGSLGSARSRFSTEHTLDYVLTHVILRTIDYTILGFILFTGMYFLVTVQARPSNLLPIIESIGGLLMLGFGLGIANMALNRVFPYWAYFFPAFWRMMMLFSGLHFVPDFRAPDIRYWLSFNPLLHAIALFREGFYPTYPHLIVDRGFFFLCGLSALFIGLAVERAMRRRFADR
jgi:capsular polysaccharide transport system permease protein